MSQGGYQVIIILPIKKQNGCCLEAEAPVRFWPAPGAGWYWNPHTAAINIPIYFLTYIFSHYLKKYIEIFFKNGGQQMDSNRRPIDHETVSQAA